MSDCFSCQGCDWATEIPNSGRQDGCHAGRLATFKIRGEASRNEETQYYDLTRICTLKREDFEGSLEQAIYQIEPLFGILIEDNGECDWEDVCAAANQVVGQDYNPSKISVILSTNMNRGMKNIVFLTEKIKAKGFRHFKSVIHSTDVELQVKELDQWRPIAQSTYFVKVRPEEQPILEDNFISLISDSIMTDLEKLTLEDWTGVTVVNASMVKALYMNFNEFDLTVDKIRELKGITNA